IYNMDHPQCYTVTSFEIDQIIEINIGEVDDITVCGDGNAIGTSFDLTQNDDAALNGQNPDDYEVVYYKVVNGQDVQIGNPEDFQNTENPQEIVVKVEVADPDVDCSAESTFLIKSLPVVDAEPEDIYTCSDDSDDIIFNLTTNNSVIIGDGDPDDYDITYYNSEDDAENQNNPIANPEDYPSDGDNETIYVRISNADDPDCYVIKSFDLISNNPGDDGILYIDESDEEI